MADNVLQAMKDLQKNLDLADRKLKDVIAESGTYEKMIADAFRKAADNAKVSVDDLLNHIRTKTKRLSEVEKIRLMVEIDEKGLNKEKIEKVIKDINAAIADKKTANVFGEEIKDVVTLTDKLNEYKALLADVKKVLPATDVESATKYQQMLKLINSTIGEKKQKYSPKTEQEAADIKAVENLGNRKVKLEALNGVQIKNNELLSKRRDLEREILEMERKDQKSKTVTYTDADGNVKKQKVTLEGLRKAWEEVDKAANDYVSKLGNLGKAGTGAIMNLKRAGLLRGEMERIDPSKEQERNFITLNRLLNKRRELYAQIAQIEKTGKSPTKEQIAERTALNNEIQKTINAMRKLEDSNKGSIQTARQKTLYQRLHATNASIEKTNRLLNQTRDNMTKMLPVIQRVASAFGVAFSLHSLTQFGKKLVEVRGEFEMQFVAMKQIIGDVDAATKIWNQTLQQALKSPKTFKELVTYTKQLAAYRVETEKLFDTTKMLADVSAGLGVDMGRLILAYGQVKAANYLRASEVRQFTEAGVNIYGELARYFSEIEGRAVGTAEVVERVTKRMVLFSDVENIFKRMTEEGGTFFNMQEIQADTVKGQIAKLHDAYDQMLNTIGEANQGTIRNLIEALNEMVRNWRDVAAFLGKNVTILAIMLPLIKTYSTGAKLAAGQTFTWSQATKQVRIELAGLTKSMKGFRLSAMLGTAAVNMFRGAIELTKMALRTFVPFLAVEGILLLINRLQSANRELKQFRKDLDDVVKTNVDSMEREILGYDVLLEKIEKTNEGSLERKKLMNEMSSKYGRYLDFVVTEKTTIDELSNAYDNVSKSIRNYTAEKIRGEQEQKLGSAMYDEYQNMVKGLTGATVTDMEGLKSYGKLTRAQAQNIAKLIKESLEKYGTADVNQIVKTYLGDTYGQGNDLRGFVTESIKEYVDSWENLASELQGIRDEIESETHVFANEEEYKDYKRRVEEANKAMQKQNELYNEQVRLIEVSTNGETWQREQKLDDLRIENAEKLIEIRKKYGLIDKKQYDDEISRLHGTLDDVYEIDYNKRLEKALAKQFGEGWRERNKEALDMYKTAVSTEDRLQQGTTQRNKQLKESYSGLKDSLKGYEAALKAGGEKESLNRNIEWTKLQMQAIELAAKLRGIDLSEEGNGSTNNIYSERIKLLQDMLQRYKQLAKEAYGYAKAEGKVSESFEDAWAAIMPDGYGDTEVPTSYSELADMLRRLGKFVPQFDKDGKLSKQVKDLEKAIADALSQVDLEISVQTREDFAKEIEEMFSDYELTLDLQKLNLPKDAAKDILDFDYTSLDNVSDRLSKWRKEMIEKGTFSEENMKLYESWMKKVTDKVYAMRKEKAKEYTKYLEHELSERAKVEMKYAADVAFVKANIKDESQKNLILSNLEDDYNRAINEFQWKSFKESDFYVEMMQDLTSMPSEFLDMMMVKLNDWVKKADVLSPKALKEVLRAREKIIDAQVAMSPIRALGMSLKEIKGFGIDGSINDVKKILEKGVLEREDEIKSAREKLENEEKTLGVLTAQENVQRTINELTLQGIDGIEATSKVEDIDSKITELRNKMSVMEKPTGSDDDSLKRLRQYEQEQREIQNTINMLVLLKGYVSEAESMGLDMSKPVSGDKTASYENVRKYKDTLEALDKAQAQDQERLFYFKQYNKAVHGLAQNISDVTGKVKGVGNAFYNVMEAFGETDEVTKVWKDFGDAMVDSMTNVLNLIPSLITGYNAAGVAINSAMGVIGLIAEGVQMVMTLVSFMARLHDTHADKVIEEQQKKIDALEAAYERLERQIQKTWDTLSYMETYNKQLVNLQQQITAIEAQREAERSKKNSDEDRIREYGETIDDLREQMEDLRQQQLETFGGIGEEGYRDAAQGFVEAWKSAFLETGDGLQGLKEHFDEFLNDWFVKQATMRIAGKMLDNVFSMIDAAVDESGPGGANVIFSEIQAIKDKFAATSPLINDALEQLAKVFGIDGGEGELSGLAAGIQGMTEEQANVLEAYWNSVRTYTANIDTNVARIAEILGAGGDRANPQLQQLQLIAANTKATHQLLQSTVKSGHPQGGYGFKVFND